MSTTSAVYAGSSEIAHSENAISNLDDELESIEIDLLLDGVFARYGYDLRQYARASLRRRVRNARLAEKLDTVSAFQDKVLHDPVCMERFLLALTVNVTSMFRDPGLFAAYRSRVIPSLRTYPFVRIWHAGCSTGEEAYSLAILMEEEGLYDRCRIYATDMNEAVLRQAKEGIYPLTSMQEFTTNYQRSGGTRSFSDYYTAAYDHVIFRPSLRRNIVFAQHNLATDGSFNEFHSILCRNVMIYFKRPLQERVHQLLFDSLIKFGTLALGRKESLRFMAHEGDYEEVNGREKLYRRIR